jgi:hypothetical protein
MMGAARGDSLRGGLHVRASRHDTHVKRWHKLAQLPRVQSL